VERKLWGRFGYQALELCLVPGHAYPLQIGMQTAEFLQAAIFHSAFLDMASGEYVRHPEALNKLAQKFKAGGHA
jgi:hypothetical protein